MVKATLCTTAGEEEKNPMNTQDDGKERRQKETNG
jgi:hypothetical protein